MRELTAAQWREDMEALVEALQRTHPNPFHTVSPHAFGAAVRALHARLPSLSGHEVVVELARLLAMVGDGHTSLSPELVDGFRRYPLRLYHFRDGLAARQIGPAWAHAGGMPLLAIDDTPAIDAYEALRPLVSCDNPMWQRGVAPALLTLPEVLHACGVASSPERAVFTFRPPDGGLVRCDLAAVDAYPDDLVDAAPSETLPLWRRQPQGANWCTELPEHHAVYAHYGSVRDTPEESTTAFFERVFALVERERAERLVLDIRQNSGGNLWLNRPLVHRLISDERVNEWGRLFVIIGRWTFSAAMTLAVELERHTRAIFVGEPTGSRPNVFGETNRVVLPHSEVGASISSLWWQCSDPVDDRRWIAPELPAPLSLEDYVANRDPALEAALGYERGAAPLAEFPERLARRLRRLDLLLS